MEREQDCATGVKAALTIAVILGAVDPWTLAASLPTLLMWMRIEHRLTRIETRCESCRRPRKIGVELEAP